MPRKASDISYGAKLIKLFSRLFFSADSYSLTELSRMLGCSKQTVLRLVDDIQSYWGMDLDVDLRGNRKYFRMKKPPQTVAAPLKPLELSLLHMCRSFTQHLLGRELFDEATRGLEKTGGYVSEGALPSEKHFAAILPGTIDYTPHQQTIKTLISAMENKRVCRIVYHPLSQDIDKTYYIKPYKLFSHKDTIYLHAGMAREPGKKYRKPDFDPMLAVHRIRKVELTEILYKTPANYDFGKIFNRDFGVMKDDRFKVQVELRGWAAKYASERVWSPDQKLLTIENGKVLLAFSASSEAEVLSWVMSFGGEAKVIRPKRLATQTLNLAKRIERVYEYL